MRKIKFLGGPLDGGFRVCSGLHAITTRNTWTHNESTYTLTRFADDGEAYVFDGMGYEEAEVRHNGDQA